MVLLALSEAFDEAYARQQKRIVEARKKRKQRRSQCGKAYFSSCGIFNPKPKRTKGSLDKKTASKFVIDHSKPSGLAPMTNARKPRKASKPRKLRPRTKASKTVNDSDSDEPINVYLPRNTKTSDSTTTTTSESDSNSSSVSSKSSDSPQPSTSKANIPAKRPKMSDTDNEDLEDLFTSTPLGSKTDVTIEISSESDSNESHR